MLKKTSKPFQKDQISSQLMSDFVSDNVVKNAISSLLVGLKTKGLDSHFASSPTSPLAYKSFSNLGSSVINSPRSPKSWVTTRVGLGLVDALSDESDDNVLLGLKMRISKSHLNTFKDDNVLLISPKSLPSKSQLDNPNFDIGSFVDESKLNFEVNELKNRLSGSLPLIQNASNSLPIPTSGIELFEEYTCIISHGPNPKTVHIFGDCVLDSETIRSLDCKKSMNDDAFMSTNSSSNYCMTCKKKLEEGGVAFMHKGEKKAFCSLKCRDQEISSDEEAEKDESNALDDCFGSLFDEEMLI